MFDCDQQPQTKLCINIHHQQVYINLPQSNQDRSASLLLMTNSIGAYRWHIRATQIRCNSGMDMSTAINRHSRQLFNYSPSAELKISLPAPPGCLQYFTTKTGVIQSFNFGHYLNNLDYAICIERLSNTCRVTFNSANGDWSISRSDGLNYQLSAVGDAQCANDYLLIPGASKTGNGRTFDRFCGGSLNYRDNRDYSSPLISKANGPIVLRFHSGTRSGPDNRAGFRVRYEQNDDYCNSDQTNLDPFLDSDRVNEMSEFASTGTLPASINSMTANNLFPNRFESSNYPLQTSRINAKRMKV